MDDTSTLRIEPNMKTLQIGRYHRISRHHGINPFKKSKEWRELGQCIGDHRKLEYLIFCDFVADGKDLKELLAGASRNKSVTAMEFICCDSQWGGWGSALGNLAAFFNNNPNLSSLSVRNCVLGQDARRALAAALGSSPTSSLKSIRWVSTRMDHKDWARFFTSLTRLRNLKRLEIRDSFGTEGCNEAARLLRHPRCALEAIKLTGNEIGNGGLASLESAIAANQSLTTISFNSMGEISPASWRSFFGILRHPPCEFKTISFSRNTIGDGELAALESAIATNNTLTTLSLGSLDGISPAGWRSFSSVLRDNRSLKNVFFKYNSIDDDAVEAFANALRGNQRLEKLWLDGNPNITDRGWSFMIKALCDVSSLDSLYNSSHSLRQLDGSRSLTLPNRLKNLLRINRLDGINAVRRIKILLQFLSGNCNMEPISHLNSNLFPHLLSWIGGESYRPNFEALFNVLRKMPFLFGNSSRVLRRSKRKRGVGS